MWASYYGADVKRSMWGRCELHEAGRGAWRASVFLPLRSCGAFSGDELEEVLGGYPILQVGYRQYVEPEGVLFEGFPKGAVFRSPLDHEFLHPSRATVMPDASRLSASQYLLDGRFVPWGVTTSERFYGGGPYSFGACMYPRGPCFPFSGDVQYYASAVCVVGDR